jgi:Predicted solute binding protein
MLTFVQPIDSRPTSLRTFGTFTPGPLTTTISTQPTFGFGTGFGTFTSTGPVPPFTSNPVPPLIATPMTPFTSTPIVVTPTVPSTPIDTSPFITAPFVTTPFVTAVTGSTQVGGFGNDTLIGGGFNDFLDGRFGNDVLVGAGSNDTLVGGPDDDLLTGNIGSDRFVFAFGDGRDVITDFSPVEGDHISLPPGLVPTIASDAAGNAVVSVSATDSVTLNGVSALSASSQWFT